MPVFKSYDEETKKVRRNLLTALCEEPETEGSDRQVGDLPYNIPEDKIELLRDRKEGIYAANARLKAIRQLFKWAASVNRKLLARNPRRTCRSCRSRRPAVTTPGRSRK